MRTCRATPTTVGALLALTTGVEPATVGPPRFADGASTCRYAYSPGGFTLAVEDLPAAAATTAASSPSSTRG